MGTFETNLKEEEKWRQILGMPHSGSPFSHLPPDPRCQICGMPFAGFGGILGKLVGFRKWNKNPSLCNRCVGSMPQGGIELDTSVIFADIRGSTSLAEKLSPKEFAAVLNEFYDVATTILAPNKAIIDKMIGDEVMALFLPLAGPDYRRKSVESAVQISVAVQDKSQQLGDIEVGIGVHAGTAYIGRVGEAEAQEFTALGDTVNVAARLQAEAKGGEIVLSEDLYTSAPDMLPDAEERILQLRGREQPIHVRVVSIGT